MRGSEPGHRVSIALPTSRRPGRWSSGTLIGSTRHAHLLVMRLAGSEADWFFFAPFAALA